MKQNSQQVSVNTLKNRQKRLVQRLLLIFAIAGIVGVPLAIWKVPQWQVGNAPLTVEEKARIDAETSARVTLIQGIGGLLVFTTAAVSWLNLKATQRNVLVAEEKQVTERFSKAVEMLSNESIYTCLGGIYALERIAKDSAKDHWQIMEILTAFVREKARLPDDQKPFHITDYYATQEDRFDEYGYDYSAEEEWDGITRTPNESYIYPTPVDIQAVLTALGRRIRTHENGKQHRLDLSRTDLRGVVLTGDLVEVNLEGANLEGVKLKDVEMAGVNLTGANLELAKFEKADLQGGNLKDARLHWAKFISTKFCGANLIDVDFTEASFQTSDLSQADLTKANFSDAILCKATQTTLRRANLSEVKFLRVNLSGIDLENTNLESAKFEKADLSNANLVRAKLDWTNLEEANLSGADLTGASVYEASLKKTNLGNAILEKTNLEGANLNEANLRGANLAQAIFKRAKLAGVDLTGAEAFGVDFSSARYLKPSQVTSMHSWQQAAYSSDLENNLLDYFTVQIHISLAKIILLSLFPSYFR
jgi:uncharacterized protein YjbI with pentapeptide repeats